MTAVHRLDCPAVDPTLTVTPEELAQRMKSKNPPTHEQLNFRMSEIQAQLSHYQLTRLPNKKALEAELDAIKKIYPQVLANAGKQP